jgi:hypothetical protein
VACTDTVYIVALHYVKIIKHVIHRGCTAEDRVAIVAVYALELGCFSVDVNDIFLDLDALETKKEADVFASALNVEKIEGWVFVAPKRRRGDCNLDIPFAVNNGLATFNCFSVGRNKRIRYGCLAVSSYFCVDTGVCKILVNGYFVIYIGNMCLIAQEQEHLAENTRITEFILALEISAIAPLENYHFNGVYALAEQSGNVDFTGHMADLAISRKLIVNIEIEAGVYALKIDVYLLFKHAFVDEHLAAVKSAGIVFGDVRGVDGDRVTDVKIVGGIVPLSEVILPAARNADLAKILAS